MKNPLRKRYLREIRTDFLKYLIIFLFMVMLISLVSGFLIADKNVHNAFNEGLEKYNVEDGHITFNTEPDKEVLSKIEKESALTFYDLKYFEEDLENSDKTLRVYKDRDEVNKECLMSGKMPETAGEIAIDRAFAVNNNISVGDMITLGGRSLKCTGLIALVDYSSLFENNTDMMYDVFNFGVAVMTAEGFDEFNSSHLYYNFAWTYDKRPSDDIEEDEKSNALIDVLTQTIESYDEELFKNKLEEIKKDTDKLLKLSTMSEEEIKDYVTNQCTLLDVDAYIPRYNNNAINFAAEDMGSDASMICMLAYIIIAVIGFAFAITISNTIMKESGTIGTLLASGYTKGELVRHYLTLTVWVTIFGALIGNILGYSVFKNMFIEVYYNNYSLATYEDSWNREAFVLTTIIPIILMFVINLTILVSRLNISPLRLLRHDLDGKGKKKAIRLPGKLPFMHRFRLRILFKNIPSYIILMLGIIIGGVVIVFGLMLIPLMDSYSELVTKTRLADYQYILASEEDTGEKSAEKFALSTFDFEKEGFVADEVSVYGIEENSKYVTEKINAGKALASNSFMGKYGIKIGDTVTLKNHFSSKEYSFTIEGEYTYDAAMAVFVNLDDYREIFEKDDDYFTGYFSNVKITDLDEEKIVSVITLSDLNKLGEQLRKSFESYMSMYVWLGIGIFVLLMFLLTKQIIERDQVSISMTKILGFSESEIARLYLLMTTIVTAAGLLISIPLIDVALRWCFRVYIYRMMAGYLPYMVDSSCYVKLFVYGMISYVGVACVMMFKINKIPMSDALKNVE